MNKQELASKIWESANKMRSKIEANEYKDYILGFIFYKFLSEKEERWLRDNDYEEDDIFHKILKIELWADSEDELEYVMKHCGTLAHELHADGKSMEFNSFQHSKATGIHDVLKMLHIPVENSYCFGDGPNDVEMFETVGHPFAMGNALDIIKEKAEAVCPDVLDDGVAVKLQELFDI